MTKNRIAQAEPMSVERRQALWSFSVHDWSLDEQQTAVLQECLEEIERLQSERDTLNRALVKQTKIAAKLRQGAK